MVAMCGWFSEASRRASRSKRARRSDLAHATGRTFSATSQFELPVSRAIDLAHSPAPRAETNFIGPDARARGNWHESRIICGLVVRVPAGRDDLVDDRRTTVEAALLLLQIELGTEQEHREHQVRLFDHLCRSMTRGSKWRSSGYLPSGVLAKSHGSRYSIDYGPRSSRLSGHLRSWRYLGVAGNCGNSVAQASAGTRRMSAAARKAVSNRMKRYWAERRKAQARRDAPWSAEPAKSSRFESVEDREGSSERQLHGQFTVPKPADPDGRRGQSADQ